MSLIISAIIFITSFLVVISALVFFHELGHYSVARFFNTAIDRFSIGFGRPIWKHTAKSGTEWTINRWPLGGYVKFYGDAGAASNPDADHLEQIRQNVESSNRGVKLEDCFHFKPLYQRFLIVLAGPVANFILAVILFGFVALVNGGYDMKSVVMDVQEGSAAEEAGVRVGDQFLRLNGDDVSLTSDLIPYIVVRSGETLQAEVLRGGDVVEFPITPRRQERRDSIGGKNAVGTIGIQVGSQEHLIERKYNPVTALGYGAEQTVKMVSVTGTYVKRMVSGRENGSALGGPTRIATMTGKSAVDISNLELPFLQKMRVMGLTLLSLAAALSVGLGIANLMPIPALDGGHLLYYGYEAVAGRPLSEQKQEFGFRIGFAILFTALIILTINDIGYVKSMLS